jgi:glycosyltransferase involved in cell wall biosynthesis
VSRSDGGGWHLAFPVTRYYSLFFMLLTFTIDPMTYVLITPARNEADYIELTIQSMIAQTRAPLRWIIVSDGSTDSTDDIVKKYLQSYPWMELVRMPERKERHFAGKVMAFNAGFEKIKNLSYNIIGNLDADITFESDYFEFLLSKFSDNSKLGVAGTPFVEDGKHYDFRFASTDHVSGACQLFRRECFEEIGGYIPIKGGGIDWTAVTTARMKGWQTRTFTEKTCFHHRKIGTGDSGSLTAIFKYGEKNYFLGGHPLWQLFRSLYQMTKKPFIIGGLLLFFGYAWGFLSRMEKPVSRELLEFYRHEQMLRLKKILYKLINKDKTVK